MQKTIVALYDGITDAQSTVRDLVDNGFARDQISLIARDESGQYSQHLGTTGEISGAAQGAGVGAGIGAALGGLGGVLIGLGALVIPGIGPVIAAGPLAAALAGVAGAGAGAIAGGATGGIVGALADMGVTREAAGYYAEGIRRGGTLVTVLSNEDMSPRAVDVMNQHHPINISDRVGEWRQGGWSGFDPNAGAYQPNQPTPMGTSTGEVYGTSTQDVGVQETPVTQTPPETPSAGTPSPFATGYRNFDYYETDFRNHYANTFGNQGPSYNQYIPAYRFGYDLATNERYRNSDWSTVEPEARAYWEERHPGTWNDFKDAVHHAWGAVKDTFTS